MVLVRPPPCQTKKVKWNPCSLSNLPSHGACSLRARAAARDDDGWESRAMEQSPFGASLLFGCTRSAEAHVETLTALINVDLQLFNMQDRNVIRHGDIMRVEEKFSLETWILTPSLSLEHFCLALANGRVTPKAEAIHQYYIWEVQDRVYAVCTQVIYYCVGQNRLYHPYLYPLLLFLPLISF